MLPGVNSPWDDGSVYPIIYYSASCEMLVKIHLFAKPKELLQRDVVEVEIGSAATSSSTVAELRSALQLAFPLVSPACLNCRFAVNHELVDDSDVVRVGDEVALIPPVSGG